MAQPEEPGLLDTLGRLLVDCVADGASVGFLAPLPVDEARAYWSSALSRPGARTFVAHDEDDALVGVVQLLAAQMPNQPHRADVAKLMVHPGARRRGVARALLATLEDEATRLGLWVLVLDTETGSAAESAYERLGWERVGTIPDYALDPRGRLHATTFFTRRLPRSLGRGTAGARQAAAASQVNSVRTP
jgi:ribosomal protein S18 acetylase RimI-like enzyme